MNLLSYTSEALTDTSLHIDNSSEYISVKSFNRDYYVQFAMRKSSGHNKGGNDLYHEKQENKKSKYLLPKKKYNTKPFKKPN